jgi:hypothetical protein
MFHAPRAPRHAPVLLLLLITPTAVEKMRFAAAVDTYECLVPPRFSGRYFGNKSGCSVF